MDDNNPTSAQPAGQQTGTNPILVPTNEDGSLPSGLGEPFDTAAVKIPAHPNTKFDDQEFASLLSGSISLTKAEKLRIIDSVPTLTQRQIDRLLEIFREERDKFDGFEEEAPKEVSELEMKRQEDWEDVAAVQAEQAQKEEEASRLQALKDKLFKK